MKHPKEWNATEKQKASGWRNNPKALAEIVNAMNEDMYIPDENEMMEYIDLALEFIKTKYFNHGN